MRVELLIRENGKSTKKTRHRIVLVFLFQKLPSNTEMSVVIFAFGVAKSPWYQIASPKYSLELFNRKYYNLKGFNAYKLFKSYIRTVCLYAQIDKILVSRLMKLYAKLYSNDACICDKSNRLQLVHHSRIIRLETNFIDLDLHTPLSLDVCWTQQVHFLGEIANSGTLTNKIYFTLSTGG